MATRLVTPPAENPVSLAEAKAHLRVEHDDDNDLIEAYIAAATSHLEELTGRVLIEQTWELIIDAFPAWEIALPKTPVQSLVSVTYSASDGLDQTVSPSSLYLDKYREPAWIVGGASGWPSTLDAVNAVRIQFVAGYGDASKVPVALKQAIMLLAGHWYEYRTEAAERAPTAIPFGVMALISPYRAWF